MSNVFVSKHPILKQKISELRRASNTPRQVRELTDTIGRLLMYEATLTLPLAATTQEQSPVGSYEGQKIAI
ncbi:hypothetical protein GGI08_007101, partial [Coemansia sp. S2]